MTLKRFSLGLASLFVCIISMDIARADDCPAGNYIDDAGTCVNCPNAKYYCPGDGVLYECPDIGGRIDIDALTREFSATDINVMHYTAATKLSKKSNCSSRAVISNARGTLDVRHYYNPYTDKYDNTAAIYWIHANPGYYLNGIAACFVSSSVYYRDALSCMAGAYCPGVDNGACKENVTHPETAGINVCPDNTYSDAGALTCTPCPTGTGNNGTEIADHAGISSCLPLCSAGAYKLHVKNMSFNLWPDEQCELPALKVGLGGGVCCVNLDRTNGIGLNIDLNGTTYHTVN